jgi:UDP-N-acetylmuramoylalanine--D-glutamate ligase
MKFEKLKSAQKILIFGFGIEGKVTKKFLHSKFPKSEIVVYDENISEYSERKDFDDFDVIVVSPGVSRAKFSENLKSKLTSCTEIFFDNLPESVRKRTIGISGSKGKSTTTKFIAEFLTNAEFKTEIIGNFGRPALEIFDDFVNEKIDFCVAELSSFQLENLQTSPHIAIFLSFFPEHLSRHNNEKNYFEAKANLWRHQRMGDVLIAPESLRLILEKERNTKIFTLKISEEFFLKDSIFQADHFRRNFGTIVALADVLALLNAKRIFQKTAQNFTGLPYRCEFFYESEGKKFYDDSISTNPNSAIAAIHFFNKKLGTIILGGEDAGGSFEELFLAFTELKINPKLIIIDSEITSKILSSAQKKGFSNFEIFDDFEKAVKSAVIQTPRNKVCILSPAGKSFDRFSNYKERGEIFKRIVRDSC